jgi:hypothetical protein
METIHNYKNEIEKELYEIKNFYQVFKYLYSTNLYKHSEIKKINIKDKGLTISNEEAFKKLADFIHQDKNNILVLIDEKLKDIKEKYTSLEKIGSIADVLYKKFEYKSDDLGLIKSMIEPYINSKIMEIRNNISSDLEELKISEDKSTEKSNILQSRIINTSKVSLDNINYNDEEHDQYVKYKEFMNYKFYFLAKLEIIDKRATLPKIRNQIFNNLEYVDKRYVVLFGLIIAGFEFYKFKNSLELALINIMYTLCKKDKTLTQQICTSKYKNKSLLDKRTFDKYVSFLN